MLKTGKRKIHEAEEGKIISFFSGIARIEGLSRVFLHEVLQDEHDRPAALVIGFGQGSVEALFFDESFDTEQPVYRTFRPFTIPVSDASIGRVIDGLGRARDGLGPMSGEPAPVFRQAPPIIARAPVVDPLITGIKIIDMTLSLGRGQRELIIGDRKLGKTTIAADIVLNQKQAEPPMQCIYVLCGQKEQKLRDLLTVFAEHNALLYTTVVAATAGDSFAAQYLAPFVGCAIAEHFAAQGKDTLVVYDDLSKHARAYRDISLLLSRPPGREAYPGDIFSLHAGLLERAAKLSSEHGGGSLSALPIVETQEGDITAFIATNIISITDGQIYLNNAQMQSGSLPAIDIGLSVSRIGGQAQPKPLRSIVGGLRLTLAQHKELAKLAKLETLVNRESKKELRRGELTLALLQQDKHEMVGWAEQAVLFFMISTGLFDAFESGDWTKMERRMLTLMRTRHLPLIDRIKKDGFTSEAKSAIQRFVLDFKQEFGVDDV